MKRGPIQVRSETASRKKTHRDITLRIRVDHKAYDAILVNTGEKTFTGALEYILKQLA